MFSTLVRNGGLRLAVGGFRSPAIAFARGISTSSLQQATHAPATATVGVRPIYHEKSTAINEALSDADQLAPTSDHVVYIPTRPTEDVGGTLTSPYAKYGPGYQFWKNTPRFANVSEEEFLSRRWNRKFVEETNLKSVLEQNILAPTVPTQGSGLLTKDEFIEDVLSALDKMNMAVRVTPYVVSRINWNDPGNDPVFKQFIPQQSILRPNHPMLKRDSLDEKKDSKTKDLVHRYPDRALFLATKVCPCYCIQCTREWEVGPESSPFACKENQVQKNWNAWIEAIDYIRGTPGLADIVVSGGDTYFLTAEEIRGDPNGKTPEAKQGLAKLLLDIPHIRRIRFATKGLAVHPSRFIDPNDEWTKALIWASNYAKTLGKSMAIHTHFNHPNEISWVTAEAAQRLHMEGVMVRNQCVLLRGINDTVATLSKLVRSLADINVIPYYVYQCDMVPNVEHLRTPFSTILHLQRHLQGSISGFACPKFVVDLPGGGGKRTVHEFQSYDRQTGRSTFTAPAITAGGKKGKVYEYWDPLDTLETTGMPKIDD